jgi:PDZ domain
MGNPTKIMCGGFIALALMVSGCVNSFAKYYKPSPYADTVIKSPYNAPTPATPPVYAYSSDPKADNHRAMEDGYVYIGEASFYANANKVSESQAVDQGKKVGAALILIHSEYKDTVSGAVPYTVQNAPVVSTVNTSGTVSSYGSSGYSSGTYSGSGTVTSPGGSTTYQIPYRFDRNTYDATFWVKRSTDKIVCGINPGPLSDEMKHKLERNSGVVVLVVVHGTPAFQANILEGDIVLKIDDEDIIDPSTFTAQLAKHAGRRANFQILRDGIPKTIPVELRPSLTP